MGAEASSSHIVSAAPSSSQGGLVTLCPCCRVESLPQAAGHHKLLQYRSLPGGAVFQNRLLKHVFPTESQVLPGDLLQHGLLSPWGHRYCQDPAPAWASHGFTASFGCIYLLRRGVLHRLQVGICSTIDLLHRSAEAQPASPLSSPQAAGESLLQCLEHILPLLLH